MAHRTAVVGFLGGFAALFLAETLTHSHTHPSDDEHSHKHSLVLKPSPHPKYGRTERVANFAESPS